MSDAMLDTGGARPAVRFVREPRQPPEVVWRALTDPAELRTWFPSDIVTDEWRVGAKLSFPFRNNEGPTLTGVVLEVDEPRLLVYTWADDTLRFELTPLPDGGTRLVLINEVDGDVAARNAAGWDVCLEYLLGNKPEPDAWKALFERYVATFEPELGSQQGPPAGV
jgi:uncharacterized protein YndB with AHSA1/START domain